MSGKVKKLQRMKARLSGEADASLEVTYELMCDCGQQICGVRRTSSIQKQCDQCGNSMFVLPINVYPATRSVKSEVIGGSFADRLKVVVGEMLPSGKSKKAGKQSPYDDTVAAAAATESTAPESSRPKVRRKLTLPTFDVKAFLRKTFTPFRMVMLAMISVLSLTGYWLVQQQAQEAAQQVWLQAADEIETLLQNGDIVELESLLQSTVAAGSTLGKTDGEWRRTVNLYQQAQAINNLTASDLLSDFHSVYRDGVVVDAAAQQLTEDAKRGHHIFDSWVVADYQNKGSFRMELPAAAGKHRVSTIIALPQLEQLLQQATDGRVLFAAKIESIAPPEENAELEWKIQLSAASFVLLTNPQLCDGIGLSADFDTELPTVLQRQDEFVKKSKTWEFRANDVVPLSTEDETSEEAAL